MLFVFIYVNWCPTGFPYQIMFMSSNNNTTGSYDVLVHPIQRDNQKRTCNTMDKIKRKKKRSTKHCTAN
jgi:hypothetical protein